MKEDAYNEKPPDLRLDDLSERDDDAPVRLSLMMTANSHRASQIARSLECLARQKWREFEVLVADNGHAPPLETIFEKFRPYLRLKTVRLERRGNSACPSVGFKALMPMADGEVFAIMQPEMLLEQRVTAMLYYGHQYTGDKYRFPWPSVQANKPSPTWITLRPGSISEKNQLMIDGIDWHSSVFNLITEDFWNHSEGLSEQGNRVQLDRAHYPWWFVASGHRDLPIWERMPTSFMHATIDFWLLNYRYLKGYTDITPPGFWCFHQRHVMTRPNNPSGVSEQDTVTLEELAKQYGKQLDEPVFDMKARVAKKDLRRWFPGGQ